jgi:hypothetical protein
MSKLSCLVLAVSMMSFGVGCAEQKGRKKGDDADKKADKKTDAKRADAKRADAKQADAKQKE